MVVADNAVIEYDYWRQRTHATSTQRATRDCYGAMSPAFARRRHIDDERDEELLITRWRDEWRYRQLRYAAMSRSSSRHEDRLLSRRR